ncbi:MAG: methyl-accepting chemotaxis protein, partial [Aquabacterium sp.]|nr:methyl-accepting chemotaxis protein [Aquabacterium sp.]
MRLSELKISHRLAWAFGLVLLMSMISGGVSLQKLSANESNLDDVVNDNNVKMRLNNEMSGAVHVVSRVTRSIMLLDDKAARQAEKAKLDQAREVYDRASAALEKMPASEAGKAMRAKIAAARAVARPLNDKVLALGMADQTADATLLLMKEAAPATQGWQEAIDANIDYQAANNQQQHDASVADYTQSRNLLIGLNLASIAMAGLLGWLVARSITRQLGAEPGDAAALAQRVAAGDLSQAVALAAGDDTSLMAQLKRMQDSLVAVVGSVRQNAESVATASAQIAQGNQDLSQRTEEQASALEETAASMEQLGSTVRQNADNARQANQLAVGASSIAVKGGEVVGQVVDTMKGINDSSKKIADIIGVIDGIAFQTNILALNAAVEAARAGEQGRGFAVVASEVRSLAQRSADAAREVKSLINASVERVEQGTALVDEAGATMQEVVSSIKRVADIMGEINAASAEQGAGVMQVGEAVTLMDQATQQNAALVEQSAAAASSLKTQAAQMVDAVAVFKLA